MLARTSGLNNLPFLFVGLTTLGLGLCFAGFTRAPVSMPVPAPGTTGRYGVAGDGPSRGPLADQVRARAIRTGQVFMNDGRKQVDQAGRFGVDVERLNQGREVPTLVVMLDKIIHLLRGQVRQFLVQCDHCLRLSPFEKIILSGNCPDCPGRLCGSAHWPVDGHCRADALEMQVKVSKKKHSKKLPLKIMFPRGMASLYRYIAGNRRRAIANIPENKDVPPICLDAGSDPLP